MNADMSVWSGDREGAVGGEVKFPASLVNQMMVPSTERHEIVDVGQTLLQPVVADVVGLGVFERCVTPVSYTHLTLPTTERV